MHRLLATVLVLLFLPASAADIVPIEVQMPGTQPGEVSNLEGPDRCDNCHQDSDPVVTIAHDWRGSMMSHAGRDPLYWSTVAIAEQDFDGSGDLCIRCHTMGGWLAGRSTPTNGSALTQADAAAGVSCDVCHLMTNPDGSEHPGVQTSPFIANDGAAPSPAGYYGSGELVMSTEDSKLGPYADAVPKHKWEQSEFHRSVDFCGSCHDVSNPVVGDLAPNNGAQLPLPAADQGVKFAGDELHEKAAFNFFPHQYGVVERTYSEYKASLFPQTLVSAYPDFPIELKAGSIAAVYDAALVAGTGGNYQDNTPRYFSCQSCHMMPMTGLGANKQGVPTRPDLPRHDLTGGNYWMPAVIQYMDAQNTLLLGGGLSPAEIAGLNDGAARAQQNLEKAAALSVDGNTLTVTNLTGHKLISGYPEGRRMWLNIVWKDDAGLLLREDGEYGPLQVSFDVNDDGVVDAADVVDTLVDLTDPNSKVYEAHGAVTQDWAGILLTLPDADPGLPVSYDRVSGLVDYTLGQVAAQPAGTHYETFHFVLNNKVVKDNRIPPYGMSYDESVKRSILPVPEDQYGSPGAGGAYNHWDDFQLNPPAGAVTATIKLMYQPTSWEYIQFLYLANTSQGTFLGDEGKNILDAWLNTGMAQPHPMATVTWTVPDSDNDGVPDTLDNCPDDANEDQLDTDTDGQGDRCDLDDDNDGLLDSVELLLGTNTLLTDTDGDTLSDYVEVNYDGDPGYNPDEDTDPTQADTDLDGLRDDVDPIPLAYNFADGDIAPLGSPDGVTNAGDLVVCLRIILGLVTATELELAHADLHPEQPDGEITISDYLKLLLIVLDN